jgi:hypothetical protein
MMSYNSIVEMVTNQALILRVAACAAEQGISNPAQWAQSTIWKIVTTDGWAEAWDEGMVKSKAFRDGLRQGREGGPKNPINPKDPHLRREIDPGARSDTITDEMISEAVTAVQQPDPA